MVPSLILNALNVLLVAGCIVRGLQVSKPKSVLFRYFTTLSNLLSAGASAAVIAAQLFGGLPFWVLLLKYVGTSAVALTMLTVVLYLGVVSKKWGTFLSGTGLFVHLICPILAIVSFLAFEKTAMPAWTMFLGIVPAVLYGILYFKKVILAAGEDFYGFNDSGKWPLSFVIMLSGTVLIAFLLWLI